MADTLHAMEWGSLLVDSHISRGSEASVFSAFISDGTEMRSVACKAYTPQNDDGRVQRELRIWRKLDHPNICPILHYSEEPPALCWLVPGPHVIMPRCDTDLFEVTSAHHAAMSAASITTVFRDVLSALEHMHGLGIAHFDLKPENIGLFLELDNPDEVKRAVLLDLGSADDALPVSDKDSRGTVEHLPPEDVMDTAADIYSLGVTLREVLQWSPEQPEWLRTLLDTRMIVEDPAQRATASELLSAIPVNTDM